MDYKQTLNITLSDKDPRAMPQRANLPQREMQIQARWDAIDLYRRTLEKPAPKGTFVLHDGPPYSNGDIHLGHALNKIAKDIIVKYKTMSGFRAPYVPGWDNHGMPIENNVSREFREAGIAPDPVTMRSRCREYATEWVERQKAQFRRLGVRGDWDHPYLTMSADFEARIVRAFAQMAEKGYVYRGLKPVLWCAECATALADAEVEYGDHTSLSIFVRFPVARDPQEVFGRGQTAPPASYLLIWTTTPWTIPANLALAVHRDARYRLVECDGDRYLCADTLCDATMAATGLAGGTVGTFDGAALAGLVCRHPLYSRESPVVFADYVTMTEGTGIVHTAPGHGKEDFDTGRREGLDVLCPVDSHGVFTAEAGPGLSGARILTGDADRRVMAALGDNLLARSDYKHSYPHCWRCHQPLLFRATVQWFMAIDHEGHRERALDQVERTRWYPPSMRNRITSMVANRPDWCLSRQRAWGVGIPVFYCTGCGRETIEPKAMQAAVDLVAREGSDAWFARPAWEILPAGYRCAGCGAQEFRKETDILDVWFDSGSTHLAVLQSPRWPELHWPADLYLEGTDQHRGWFNSSLMVAVAIEGAAPYREVITNGWTLDESGKQMHKSWGNAVAPTEAVETYGADMLRLWVASTDYFDDVRCSEAILKQVAETYRRIRNTFRMLVNNVADFDPTRDAVPYAELHDLDRWALARLCRTVDACRAGYESYEFHRVYHAVHNFCTVDLSAFYLDVLKDRLYCSGRASRTRRSAQTVMHRIADAMARLLAPVLSHTAEEVWDHLAMDGKPASVHLADFPDGADGAAEGVLASWAPLLALRDRVQLAIEVARQEKRIANPLEAVVRLSLQADTCAAVQPYAEHLAYVLRVSQAELRDGAKDERIEVARAEGAKCARCWLVRQDVGSSTAYPDLCGRCTDVVEHWAAGASD
ncbi:MAG TPA: isoleucine--tRNA ligase [Chthonomonadales bacterium]|nr:isoleucine--tRNA ligase [Chthonomonadales bacterium]